MRASQYETIDEDGKRVLRCVDCHYTRGEHDQRCPFILGLAREQKRMAKALVAGGYSKRCDRCAMIDIAR